MTASEFVAALDVGGTKTSAAMVDAAGRIVARNVGPTPATGGADAVLDAAAQLVTDAIGPHLSSVTALGVGTAGVVDPESGRILSSTDAIRSWAGTDVAGGLRRRLGLPVAVDNDVHAHLVGELTSGAAVGTGCAVLVAVGTGVGGSVALGGRIHRGRGHVAGHVGHVPSPTAGATPCSCGGTGHVEAIASGPALVRAYNARSLRRLPNGASSTRSAALNLVDVVARATAGVDPDAVTILENGGTEIGRLIGGLVNVLDPDLVVVTGGVSESGPIWWDAMRRAVTADLLPPLRAGVTIDRLVVRSLLGNDAALVGVAQIARERAA